MEKVCIFIVLYAFVFPPTVFAISLKILKVSIYSCPRYFRALI